MTHTLARATGCDDAGPVPRVASAAGAHIGGRIAQARQSAGLTQDQLAAATGIDSSNIRAYESGRSMLSIHSLIRLAIALRIEPGELLAGTTLQMFERPADAAPDRRKRSA